MRIIVACLLTCGVAFPAGAQSLPDKLCAVSMAQKLPNVAGASFGAFTFKAGPDKVLAVKRLFERRGLRTAALEMDQAFGFLNHTAEQKLKNSYPSDALEDEIAQMVQPRLADVIDVRTELQVSNIKIVYAGTCLRGINGAVVAGVDGAVQ